MAKNSVDKRRLSVQPSAVPFCPSGGMVAGVIYGDKSVGSAGPCPHASLIPLREVPSETLALLLTGSNLSQEGGENK